MMYAFVVELLQPHTLLFLWACFSLFRLWWKRNAPGRRLWPLFAPLLSLYVLCTPAAAHLALLSLESYSPPLAERPTDAGAVVVFSAGVSPPQGPRVRPEMDEDTLQRCIEAARLYFQGPPCLVVASGGGVDAADLGPSFAAVMGGFLEQLGVKEADLVREETSRTTYENAVECAKLLKDRGIGRVVLAADAVDMFRAAACLRKQGIEVVPAPCHYRATRFRLSVPAFLPFPSAAAHIQRVWHEWLGVAWYWTTGRL
jgi:uncharacterized SAM-binding protein YcdF (DUF218 family)